MAEFGSLFVILALIGVIITQAVERYFYSQAKEQEVSRLITAVMSKDLSEYTHAIKVEKEVQSPPTVSDEEQISELDDTEFDKHIQNVIS